MERTRKVLLVLVTAFALLAAPRLGMRAAFATPPTLTPVADEDLERTYRAGAHYTLRLRYADPDGDAPKSAQLTDEAPSGRITIPSTSVEGTDYKNGAILVWDVNGFEQGRHRLTFTARSVDGEARYPALGQPFEIVAESLTTKLGIMAAGLAVGLVFLPFLVYVLARSLNKRGDPSGAARVGLLIGILACCALFMYLFASFYGPLIYVIGGIAALALFVVVLTRR